jgi:uncharacterized NAD(P)/FAD-binding protein YdhS
MSKQPFAPKQPIDGTVAASRDPPISVAIIGMGPRGLGLLERLAANLTANPALPSFDLHLIDPHGIGEGVHDSRQPDDLLVNTVAGQITIFSDPSICDAGPHLYGPRFDQYAMADENDYLPRAELGRYLKFGGRYLRDMIAERIGVSEHLSTAVDVIPRKDGYVIALDNAAEISANLVLLCTGHRRASLSPEQIRLRDWSMWRKDRNPLLAYFPRCYPLSALSQVPASAHVGIRGVGLSANDVVASLTTGRGGRFERASDDRLFYTASGFEPQLILFSRQSLPFSARGRNEKGLAGQHLARFCTREAVETIRANHRRRGLPSAIDFSEELLPLILKEMCLARREARGEETNSLFSDGMTQKEHDFIKWLFDPIGTREFADASEFHGFVREHMQADLAEAERGNRTSEVKAATDVLRDVRDSIRYAVDQAGLTPESHRKFIADFMPVMNRIAVGPPKGRVEEWIALLDAGIIEFAGPRSVVELPDGDSRFVIATAYGDGDSRREIDVLIEARIDAPSVEQELSPLTRNLLQRGLVRPFRNGDFAAGGIDVTEDNHPRDAAGRVRANLWVLGTPTEGAAFYTYVLPRPYVNSRFIADAGRVVSTLLQEIGRRVDRFAKSDAAPSPDGSEQAS